MSDEKTFKAEQHKLVRIKVNAWVDEGVAPLVVALNEFDCIETVDSCWGHNIGPYVYFRCATAKETADFVYWLWNKLSTHFTDCSSYDIRIEWGGTGQPMAQIQVSRTFLPTLVAALKT